VQQLSGLELLLQQHRQQQQPPAPQQQQQPQAAPVAATRVVYIMRGLPGSGKSTRAAEIAAAARAAAATTSSSSSSVQAVAIHSTDSYFVDPLTGVYDFNPELLSVNHQKNLEAFCVSLAAGVGTVIVDNTNIQVSVRGSHPQRLFVLPGAVFDCGSSSSGTSVTAVGRSLPAHTHIICQCVSGPPRQPPSPAVVHLFGSTDSTPSLASCLLLCRCVEFLLFCCCPLLSAAVAVRKVRAASLVSRLPCEGGGGRRLHTRSSAAVCTAKRAWGAT
jgi:hypothetical protein